MSAEQNLKYFLQEIFPFILVVLGFFSNLFILIVFSKKKLKLVPGKNLLKLIAIIDFLCCLIIVARSSEANILKYSYATCKLGSYVYYSCPTISAWLLGYISIEKLLTIRKPQYKNIFVKKNYQTGVALGILASNAILYSHILLFDDIFSDSNSTNKKCDIYRTNSYEITSNLHLIDGSILPFLVMLTCSIYLLIFISKSRKRASMSGQKLLKRRDIQFTLQTLILDVLFIVLNAPLYFVRVIKMNELSLGFHLLFFSRFTLNFFIYLTFNSLFRREFICLFINNAITPYNK